MNTIISFDYDILSFAFALARSTQPYVFALHTSNIWFSVSIWMNAWVHWNFESLSYNLCCNWQTKIKTNCIIFMMVSLTHQLLLFPQLFFFFFDSGFADKIHHLFHKFWVTAVEQTKKNMRDDKKWCLYFCSYFESRPNKCSAKCDHTFCFYVFHTEFIVASLSV